MGGPSAPETHGVGKTINFTPGWSDFFNKMAPSAATYMWQKGIDPSKEAEKDLFAVMQEEALSKHAGANKRLSGTLASQGFQPGSGLMASMARGLETGLMREWAGLKAKARQAQDVVRHDWLNQAIRGLGLSPHMGTYQESESGGGGGGK